MSKFQVQMNYPDGSSEMEDGLFDTEEEAEEHGLYMVGCYREGGEVLNLSNPGDYSESFDDAGFEIIEVED